MACLSPGPKGSLYFILYQYFGGQYSLWLKNTKSEFPLLDLGLKYCLGLKVLPWWGRWPVRGSYTSTFWFILFPVDRGGNQDIATRLCPHTYIPSRWQDWDLNPASSGYPVPALVHCSLLKLPGAQRFSNLTACGTPLGSFENILMPWTSLSRFALYWSELRPDAFKTSPATLEELWLKTSSTSSGKRQYSTEGESLLLHPGCTDLKPSSATRRSSVFHCPHLWNGDYDDRTS